MNNKHIFYYTLECVDDDASDEPGIDTGPDNSENYEKVYHDESEMSSFLPTHLHKKKKKISLMMSLQMSPTSIIGK